MTDSAADSIGSTVDVRIVLEWVGAGQVALDAGGKLFFGSRPVVPGLYRIWLSGGRLLRSKVYIGETDELRRRLSINYRNPGPRQATNLRVNKLLREHLGTGGRVDLAIATEADVAAALLAQGESQDFRQSRAWVVAAATPTRHP